MKAFLYISLLLCFSSFSFASEFSGSEEWDAIIDLLGSVPSGYENESAPVQNSHAQNKVISCFRTKADEYSKKIGCKNNRGATKCKSQTKPSSESTGVCFRYVKLILRDCGAADYWSENYARNAGRGLKRQGYKITHIKDPGLAPIGAVIVYGHNDIKKCRSMSKAGHAEIKIEKNKYASDYISKKPRSEVTSCRTVKGIYVKTF